MQVMIESIEAVQVGNSWDPYVVDNAFTLDSKGFTWTTAGTYQYASYKYMTMVVNAYEGCLITLAWYRQYDASNVLQNIQIVRTTYTIKTRVNYVNGLSTEYQSLNTFTYSTTSATGILQTCRTNNKYYYHPYKNIYFYLDKPDTVQQIVFTCIPYTTSPTTACSYGFNPVGTPTFKASTLTDASSNNVVRSVIEIVAFTRSTAYMAAVYRTASNWQHRIYKLLITGSSCTDYVASFSATPVYTSADDTNTNNINNLVVIP